MQPLMLRPPPFDLEDFAPGGAVAGLDGETMISRLRAARMLPGSAMLFSLAARRITRSASSTRLLAYNQTTDSGSILLTAVDAQGYGG